MEWKEEVAEGSKGSMEDTDRVQAHTHGRMRKR